MAFETILGTINEEIFIIHTSMLGLGLLIAVYTLVYPKIEVILNNSANKVMVLECKFDLKQKELSPSGLSKKRRDGILKELNNINNEIDIEYKPPFELFWGFIVTLGFFSLPLIKISFDVLNIPLFKFLDGMLLSLLFGGVLSLVLLFILIFVRLHSLVMSNFDERVKNIRGEINQKLKSVKAEKK